MDASELLERYAAGERNFIGVELSGADLRDAKLSNADLTGTNLRNVNLKNADLSNATLIATLTAADLSNANLSGARLSGDLTEADLSGAKWNGIIFPSQRSLEELQQENKRLTRRINILKATLKRRERNQANNQGINAPHKWNGFYFRSQPEIKIAEALDRAGVLFYPNCKARLSTSVGREGKETDFLVFYQGKCGILEVDGEPWHPPSRVVHDHERDRLFKVHGIRVVEHYDANRCSRQPDEVVREFLEILKQA
jgi:hypothetical protein